MSLCRKPLPAICIVAGCYPALSETFVVREVNGLVSAGVSVHTLSLHQGESVPGVSVADGYVYGGGFGAMISWMQECAAHPIRSTRTLAMAAQDALWPGEPIACLQRIKVLAQALVALASAARVRSWEIAHIHCHFAHAPTTHGMYLASQLGVPFSFVGHANDLFQRRTLLKRKLQRAAFVSCISRWHRDLYRSICPAGIPKFKVIRCGVDTSTWMYREPRQTPRLHVVSVCRLVEKKGIDTLLRAVGLLAGHEEEAVDFLTIAGDGPEMPGLKHLADKLGVNGRIRWLGAIGNEAVRDLMSTADAFVLPCREDSSGDRDGVPVVLIEAMACGVPVVSGDLPAIRELVIDGSTGMLVNGSPEQVAAAISLLASDVELRRQLARTAAEHVQREFSLDVNIDRLRKAIEKASA